MKIAEKLDSLFREHNYTEALKVIQSKTIELKLTETKTYEKLEKRFAGSEQAADMTLKEGNKNIAKFLIRYFKPFGYKCDDKPSTPLQEKIEWWRNRIDRLEALENAARNKDYRQAYNVVHNAGRALKLEESRLFQLLEGEYQLRMSGIASAFQNRDSHSYPKILDALTPFDGAPQHEDEIQWWKRRIAAAEKICELKGAGKYDDMFDLLERESDLKLEEMPLMRSFEQTWGAEFFMVQARDIEGYDWLLLKMWFFAWREPADQDRFRRALADYLNKKDRMCDVQSILAQMRFRKNLGTSEIGDIGEQIRDWLKIHCPPARESKKAEKHEGEILLLADGLRRLECFDQETAVLEAMDSAYIAKPEHQLRLKTLKAGRPEIEVRSIDPSGADIDHAIDMSFESKSEEEIRSFFHRLSRNGATLSYGLAVKSLAVIRLEAGDGELDFSVIAQEAGRLTVEEIKEIEFRKASVRLMGVGAEEIVRGWLFTPDRPSMPLSKNIGLFLYAHGFGNRLGLFVYSVFLPDPAPNPAGVEEANRQAADLLADLKSKENTKETFWLDVVSEEMNKSCVRIMEQARRQAEDSGPWADEALDEDDED